MEATRPVALSRVQFVDKMHGWLAAAPNDLWRTHDGGISWEPIANPCALNARALSNPFAFTDARHGWMLCDGDLNPFTQRMTLFATTDGGASWRPVQQDHRRDPALQLEPDPYNSRVFDRISDIGFADARHGWIGTSEHLLLTDDGGVSWRLASGLDRVGGFLRVVEPQGGGTGFVINSDERTTLLGSDDNGAHWRQLYPPITPLWPNLTAFSPTQALGIGSVLNPSAILKTWDAGQTWSEIATVNPAWRALPLPAEHYGTITRRSTTTIYLSTSDRVPRVSHDGGATFQRLPGPPLAGRYSSWQNFVVVSDRLWWHVADEGFTVTTDGGRRWTDAAVPEHTWVWGVRPNGDLWYWRDRQCASDYCAGRQLVFRGDQWLLFDFGALPVEAAPTFLDDRHGWLSVKGGRWYRTDNGGATWTQLA